jgi:hypothetical protein
MMMTGDDNIDVSMVTLELSKEDSILVAETLLREPIKSVILERDFKEYLRCVIQGKDEG